MRINHAFAALTIAALLMVVGSAHALHSPHGGRYIAAQTDQVNFAMWCGAEDHQIVHNFVNGWLDSAWFPGPDENFPWSEPECAHADAANAAREVLGQPRTEWGYGGFYWAVPPAALGTLATVHAEDDAFDAPFVAFVVQTYGTGPSQTFTVEGCGPQSQGLPSDLYPHWTSRPSDPVYLFMAFLPSLGVGDDLDLCLGSMGRTWATYGA